MNIRHRRRYSHLESTQQTYKPIIGILNPIAELNCQIQFQKDQHKYGILFQHPLLAIINKLSKKIKQYAMTKLIETTFQTKIQEKLTFIPQALLRGDSSVIHDYKKMLQKGRIDGYIKLNIKQRSVSREKKPGGSMDHIHLKQQSNQYLSKTTKQTSNNIFSHNNIDMNNTNILNQYSINVRKNIYHKKQENQMSEIDKNQIIREREMYNKTQTINKRVYDSVSSSRLGSNRKQASNLDNSLAISQKLKQFQNQNNLKANIENKRQTKVSSTVHQKQQNNFLTTTNSKTIHHHTTVVKKSSKKPTKVQGIKINYTVIKNEQNPQLTNNYIYKSNASKSKTKQSPSFSVPKTVLLDPSYNFQKRSTLTHHQNLVINKNNLTNMNLNNTRDVLMNNGHDLSFSVNQKTSQRNYNYEYDRQKNYHTDNLSQRYDRSVKNSQTSQMTHNQVIQGNYFYNQKKLLKKGGRKAIYVQDFQMGQM